MKISFFSIHFIMICLARSFFLNYPEFPDSCFPKYYNGGDTLETVEKVFFFANFIKFE